MFILNRKEVNEKDLIKYLNAHCRGKHDIPFQMGQNCFHKSGHMSWIIGGIGCEQAIVKKR